MRDLTPNMKKRKKPRRQAKDISKKSTSRDMPNNLWKARVVSTNDFEFCSPPVDMGITRGDFVVMITRYGMDLACMRGPVSSLDSVETASIRRIIRIATGKDFFKRSSLEKLEREAFKKCHEKISKLKLAMKLVSSHCTLDERKILFFFIAEKRIDFRELAKLLTAHFKKRIELRHVGARDETKMVGGAAVCGRLYCCHSITDQLASVSIKMAKDQNLPLNLLKATGPCNRLLCCLSYELENYAGEKKQLPRRDTRIAHEGVIYEVAEINMLSRTIQLSASGGRLMYVNLSDIVQNPEGGWEIRNDRLNTAENK